MIKVIRLVVFLFFLSSNVCSQNDNLISVAVEDNNDSGNTDKCYKRYNFILKPSLLDPLYGIATIAIEKPVKPNQSIQVEAGYILDNYNVEHEDTTKDHSPTRIFDNSKPNFPPLARVRS